jgi:hypothetical protein
VADFFRSRAKTAFFTGHFCGVLDTPLRRYADRR